MTNERRHDLLSSLYPFSAVVSNEYPNSEGNYRVLDLATDRKRWWIDDRWENRGKVISYGERDIDEKPASQEDIDRLDRVIISEAKIARDWFNKIISEEENA